MTKRVTDPQAQADRWGYIQVTLIVKRTTTTVGTKKTVRRKITGVTVPVYPNHTDRSAYINQQALPWLKQETLAAQFKGNIQLISGATNTSDAFAQSLTAALDSVIARVPGVDDPRGRPRAVDAGLSGVTRSPGMRRFETG